MSHFAEFMGKNAALLVALLALIASLRAGYVAHRAFQLNVRNREDADRVRVFQKKRELLNELDIQDITIEKLSYVLQQEVLLFEDSPRLTQLLPDELPRLRNNLDMLPTLKEKVATMREAARGIGLGTEIETQEDGLTAVRRLTIHLEKDIEHEKLGLEQLRRLAASAPIG